MLVVRQRRSPSRIQSREVVRNLPLNLLGNGDRVVRNERDERFVEVLLVGGVDVTRIEGGGRRRS